MPINFCPFNLCRILEIINLRVILFSSIKNDSITLGFWSDLHNEILFNELISSFSNDNQKLQMSFISQKITQHLSPAIGLDVFFKFISATSNPLTLNSWIMEGNKWSIINSLKGFFSIGSSFFGFIFNGIEFRPQLFVY